MCPRLSQHVHHDGPVSTTLSTFHYLFADISSRNTVTGHLSVIYTVECQINFTLRLIAPIIRSLPSYRSQSWIPTLLTPATPTVEVKPEAARADSLWTQREAKKLVWASGCVNWAIDEKTGLNNMMYPDWQYWYWIRSIFWKKADFVYRDEKSGKEVRPTGSYTKTLSLLLGTSAIVGAGLIGTGVVDGQEVLKRVKGLDSKTLVAHIKSITA
jgi:hypothetical protein